MYDTFGTFLRQLRREQHMTQSQVAHHLGITRQAYAYYEQSDSIPSLEFVMELAKLFSAPIQAFTCYFPKDSILVREGSSYCATPYQQQEQQDFLTFYSEQENMKKYHYLNRAEKELMFAFHRLTLDEQDEVLQFAQFKTSLRSHKGAQDS